MSLRKYGKKLFAVTLGAIMLFGITPEMKAEAATSISIKYCTDGLHYDASSDTASVTIEKGGTSLTGITGTINIDISSNVPAGQAEVNFNVSFDAVPGGEGGTYTFTAVTPKGTAVATADLSEGDTSGFASTTISIGSSSDSESGGSKHSKKHRSDSAADFKYVETENGIAYGGIIDGKFASTTVVPASAYPKFGEFAGKKITQAESGKEIVLDCEPWTSIPKSVLEAFAAKGDVSLTLNYTYKGDRYTVKLPAGTDTSTLIDENGYCGLAYLGAKLGAVPYTEE